MRSGNVTLYGTCYGSLALYYLGENVDLSSSVYAFVTECQDAQTGLMAGPELKHFAATPGVMHDREHLLWHSTCTAVPACQEFAITLLHPVKAAHAFCHRDYLGDWLNRRDLTNAWFEGNNLLFIGQLLVYLRDVERHPGAQDGLDAWFDWLDRHADPATSLWGTNGFCSPASAVYGGYHQLLVYWHENRPILNPHGLVDTVLSLRHPEGGFNPAGNAGACEDVDSVDILVNCFKRWDYRRAEIRQALWYCVDHILATQNPDGGFPYNCNCAQSHMGIPGTHAGPNASCTFPTWFRIHTLALCREIIPEHPQLAGIRFRFSNHLSMGWHKSPAGWKLEVSQSQLEAEKIIGRKFSRQKRMAQMSRLAVKATAKLRRTAGRIKRCLTG